MKSPNARRAYAYGPPVRGSERPRPANTSASRIAPAPVKIQARIEIGPAVPASDAGSRNTPEPIMLPTTSAVAIQRPIERLSFGAPPGVRGSGDLGVRTDMAPPWSQTMGFRPLDRPSRRAVRHPVVPLV